MSIPEDSGVESPTDACDGLLEAIDVHRIFTSHHGRDTVTALDGVSISICAGQRRALIGSSGSGKSTLLSLLLAAERPTRGTVRFQGEVIEPRKASRMRPFRRAVQFIPQDCAASLDPRMTIEELVTDPLRRLGIPGDHRHAALQALENVHLPSSLLGRKRAEISGGQAQRVAIARAVAIGPKILLADEPVSGLDLPLRDQVLSLLRELSLEQHLGVLLVTHDLDAARALCHDAVVLDRGQVADRGDIRDMMSDPQHPATSRLVHSMPRIPSELMEARLAHHADRTREGKFG
ncbi:ATP-binding cassette domain-containing protein [Nesterenkonia sandarakina]|uniref:Peptide/nickel transport system ATP-binding protein n=1 Tax=Nesterenkonia sandarakina TaxID=272918 RepID=A0A2T0YBC0_9MICC|nr:dipeptide/oligopeptide/nickel ABC transporter ATP-binding protein [Nesterenkonia sandarakina]PRZ12013.1 peptide/nickel transport system ATP-binding protein [Nesterenkonia sandarakina]